MNTKTESIKDEILGFVVTPEDKPDTVFYRCVYQKIEELEEEINDLEMCCMDLESQVASYEIAED